MPQESRRGPISLATTQGRDRGTKVTATLIERKGDRLYFHSEVPVEDTPGVYLMPRTAFPKGEAPDSLAAMGWRRRVIKVRVGDLKDAAGGKTGKRAVIFAGTPIFSNHWCHVAPLHGRPKDQKKQALIHGALTWAAQAKLAPTDLQAWCEEIYPDTKLRFGRKSPGTTLAGGDPSPLPKDSKKERKRNRYLEAAYSELVAPFWHDSLWPQGPSAQYHLASAQAFGPAQDDEDEADRRDPKILVGILPPVGTRNPHKAVQICEGLVNKDLNPYAQDLWENGVVCKYREREGATPEKVQMPVSRGLLAICQAAAVRSALAGPIQFRGDKQRRKMDEGIMQRRSWEGELVSSLAKKNLQRLLQATLTIERSQLGHIVSGLNGLEHLLGDQVMGLLRGEEASWRKLRTALGKESILLYPKERWSETKYQSVNLVKGLSTWLLSRLEGQTGAQEEQEILERLCQLKRVATGVEGAGQILADQFDFFARSRRLQNNMETLRT